MRLSNTFRKSVLLTNTETGKTQEFSSMTDAGIYLDISRVSVRKYLLNNMPYKGYTISKAPCNDIVSLSYRLLLVLSSNSLSD